VRSRPRFFADRATWRAWLETNHDRERQLWMLFHKVGAGRTGIAYGAAVEEAICFGWIDSLVRRIDDATYARKFTRRVDPGKWSAANLARLGRMKAAGKMTPAGLAVVADDVGPSPAIASRPVDPPPFFAEALDADARARRFFESLPPSERRSFVAWVSAAKREATRRRRLAEAMDRLRSGRRLGLK